MKKLLARIRRGALAFSLAAIAAVTLLGISESSYRASVESLERLEERQQIRLETQMLILQLVGAESGQRGYLLTGRPEYLEPYRKALQAIGQSLARLGEHYRQDEAQQADFERLATAIADKLSELETTLQARRQGRESAWQALLETDIGREHMDHIRAASVPLLAHETARIDEQREAIHRTLLLSRIGIGALAALSVLAFLMVLRQGDAVERERAEQRRTLQRERDMLEEQVHARTQQLVELTHHLQTAREDERSRLASDLHDELGALLTAAKLDLARLKSRLSKASPDALERINHLNDALNSGIALKRRIIEELRPSSLSNLGLVAALDILCREFAKRAGVDLRCELEPVRLSRSGDLTAYRLVQEALTNVAKYAQARHVTVSLQSRDGRVEVAVEDDGVGFDSSVRPPETHGLFGMRYRVEAEGGRMNVISAPGEGTRIVATLPSPQPQGTAAPVIGKPD